MKRQSTVIYSLSAFLHTQIVMDIELLTFYCPRHIPFIASTSLSVTWWQAKCNQLIRNYDSSGLHDEIYNKVDYELKGLWSVHIF